MYGQFRIRVLTKEVKYIKIAPCIKPRLDHNRYKRYRPCDNVPGYGEAFVVVLSIK